MTRDIANTKSQPLRIPGDRLQALLDRLVERKGFQHAVLAVETTDGTGRWCGAAGRASLDDTPMTPDTPYFIASIDKLYASTVIHRLSERGQLKLTERISAYLPHDLTDRIHVLRGIDRSDEITVGHLLGHTSGLADYLEDRPRGGRSLIERLFADGEDFALTTELAIRTVRDELVPHFPPQDPESERSKVRYCDTNYLLLIAIIENLTERSLHDVYDEFIFAPAGMRQTYFVGVSEPKEPTPEPAKLWSGAQAIDLPQVLESLWSIYSTPADQIASLRALLSGSLFEDPATVGRMQSCWKRFGFPLDVAALRAPSSPIEYAFGIMRFALPRVFTPIRPIPSVIGHTGSTGTWLFYCPRFDLMLAGAVDDVSAGAVPFRVIVPRVLRAIEDANRQRFALLGRSPG